MEQMKRHVLLIPEKLDAEFEEMLEAWENNGGIVKRLGKYWIRQDTLPADKIAIYGNQTFALVLEQIYHLHLLTPDDSLIAHLDFRWTKRNIRQSLISEITAENFPAFIKPVIPKLFTAGIFEIPSDFQSVIKGLKDAEEALVSDIVTIEAEARAFVADGQIMDMALYEGNATIAEGRKFLENFLAEHAALLPLVVVVDLAYNTISGWFVLEFNACWGAGLNNCAAAKVISCIERATTSA